MTESSTPFHSTFHAFALNRLISTLESYGNQISSDHRIALSGLCELASRMAHGEANERIRFALPCGMGKTTAIRAILTATQQLELPYRIVVASSKVEELCSLKRTLMGIDLIPEGMIGLQHSYPCNPTLATRGVAGYASEHSSNPDAQFLLVTHANVQAGTLKQWMREYDLVLFDESLIVGRPHCLQLLGPANSASVFNELLTLKGHAQFVDHSLSTAAAVSDEIYAALHSSAKKQQSLAVGVVQAQCVPLERIRAARESLSTHHAAFPLILQLLDWCESAEELRVFSTAQDRSTLLTYSVSVPDELTRVIVLDASDPIRQLAHEDHRMKRAEDYLPSLSRFRRIPGGMASVKQHADVQVHFASEGGGRSILTEKLETETSPWFLEKLVRLIKTKPNETFLIVTYRARSAQKDFVKRILQALSAAGIDPLEQTS